MAIKSDDQVAWAIQRAAVAHEGQVDKQGRPYIYHVIRVGMAGTSVEEQVVGILHDAYEDSPNTMLLGMISHEIRLWPNGQLMFDAIQALTRDKASKEQYIDYIARVAKNPLARAVKLHDLADNMSRMDGLPNRKERDGLMARYLLAMDVLTTHEAADAFEGEWRRAIGADSPRAGFGGES